MTAVRRVSRRVRDGDSDGTDNIAYSCSNGREVYRDKGPPTALQLHAAGEAVRLTTT